MIDIYIDSEGNVDANGLTPGQIIRLHWKGETWMIQRFGVGVHIRKEEKDGKAR